MNKYEIAVFDVDGTLLDTTEGVLASVKYTIDKMGFTPLGDEKLLAFIGPPIQDSFAKVYHLKGEILQTIATCFATKISYFISEILMFTYLMHNARIRVYLFTFFSSIGGKQNETQV